MGPKSPEGVTLEVGGLFAPGADGVAPRLGGAARATTSSVHFHLEGPELEASQSAHLMTKATTPQYRKLGSPARAANRPKTHWSYGQHDKRITDDFEEINARQNRSLIALLNECTVREWQLKDEDLDQLFTYIDSDCGRQEPEGTITKSELKQALVNSEVRQLLKTMRGPLRTLLRPALAEEAWNEIDVDESNTICKDEWRLFIQKIKELKLEFLESSHHLLLGGYWGYGCKDSLPSQCPPPKWLPKWCPVYGGDEPRFEYEEGADGENVPILSLEGQGGNYADEGADLLRSQTGLMSPKQMQDADQPWRRILCGLAWVPRGYGSDFWYYLCNNHTLLSQFYADKDHPIDTRERKMMEFILCGHCLLMTAGHNCFKAIQVATDLPDTCETGRGSSAAGQFFNCVLFNCVCSPGRLDGCPDLLCRVENSIHQAHGNGRDLEQSCTYYNATNPEGTLCWDTLPWQMFFMHQGAFNCYNLFLITIPALILTQLLFIIMGPPCTIVDRTSENYTPSKLRDCCAKASEHAGWILSFIALVMWCSCFYFLFTEWTHYVLGLPAVHGEWVENHWTVIPSFIFARCTTYVVQVVMILVMAFNPWAMNYTFKEDGSIKEGTLKWWCDPDRPVGFIVGFLTDIGRYHFERRQFFERASEVRITVELNLGEDGKPEDPGWELEPDMQQHIPADACGGVNIVAVAPRSPAENAGLRPLMRVRRVNDVKCWSREEVSKVLAKAQADDDQEEGGASVCSVMLLVTAEPQMLSKLRTTGEQQLRDKARAFYRECSVLQSRLSMGSLSQKSSVIKEPPPPRSGAPADPRQKGQKPARSPRKSQGKRPRPAAAVPASLRAPPRRASPVSPHAPRASPPTGRGAAAKKVGSPPRKRPQ